jgi:large subunit ribosomal protein L10
VDRAEKQQEIEALHQTFASNDLVVVGHYRGLTAAEITDLRRQMRQAEVSGQVVKNTLARRALKGTAYENIADLLKGPTMVAASKDPIAAAKVVYDFAKKNDKFVILGGGMGSLKLDSAAVKQLAQLPSLDELRSKLLGILVAPATRIATVTQAPASQVARVLRAYADKG